MSIETWIAFVLASAMVVVIPGPNVVLTVTHALRDGRRSGWATVPGVALGALVGMSVSLAGAGAVLAASATAFTVMKLLGGCYLIWMAIQLWRAPATDITAGEAPELPFGRLFVRSFLISVLNPKGPIFYIAFVPQFVDTSAPVALQFGVLVLSFVGVALINSLCWLYGASALRALFAAPRRMRIVQRVSASVLGLAGAATLRVSRPV
ncbi:threonine/homoserine/homoserine lactone efflux protein [Rubricella aquisinus]|uniref:Threonine/homoserine/homoserine lactone efflux protein n=1 Tax=Rubricella aquisinus TaxID=2028108 RepID=A0A840WFY3_9RHOB|nr:LysE family translocator [Rubricella aquisinus]MBB5514068.1 threonine/homoserine/homoserine lactone efflux protein [Rubricella aquisinus]